MPDEPIILRRNYWEGIVFNGVKWLDKTYGGAWVSRIDLIRLDLSDDQRCILGQLEGSFGEAKDKYGLTWDDLEAMGLCKPYRYIGRPVSGASYGYGRQVWRDVIEELRAAA